MVEVIFQNNSNEKTFSHKQYLNATDCLEELINLVDDNTPTDNPLAKEWERKHYYKPTSDNSDIGQILKLGQKMKLG